MVIYSVAIPPYFFFGGEGYIPQSPMVDAYAYPPLRDLMSLAPFSFLLSYPSPVNWVRDRRGGTASPYANSWIRP